MPNYKLLTIAFLLVINGCTSYIKPNVAEFNTMRNISIVVKGEPEFSHIGAITDESFWITMAAGPLRSAIVRNTIDYIAAKSINHKSISSFYRLKFIQAFEDIFTERNSTGRFDNIKVVKNVNEELYINTDGIVSLEITDWGTRVKQPKSSRIFPFMELEMSMTRTVDKKLVWNESRIITNDTQHLLKDYEQQHDLFDHDMTELINKVATQVTALLTD